MARKPSGANSRSNSGKKRPEPPKDPKAALVAAALKLAAERPWAELSLAEIGEAAGLTMAETYAATPSKTAILAAYRAQVDEVMLAEGPADPADTPRDRLFDVVMRRFDALQPNRAAAASMLAGATRDPAALVCSMGAVDRSLRWMLEAAGIDAQGWGGRLRMKGLGLIVACTARAWLKDETDDMSETMAALDKALSRAEQVYGFACRLRSRPVMEPEPQSTSGTA